MAAHEPNPIVNTPPVAPDRVERGEQRQAGPQANDGHHPLISFIGFLGYGRRGTLRRKHVTTLCFKLLLGLTQVSVYTR